jgi:hypothetical protein
MCAASRAFSNRGGFFRHTVADVVRFDQWATSNHGYRVDGDETAPVFQAV